MTNPIYTAVKTSVLLVFIILFSLCPERKANGGYFGIALPADKFKDPVVKKIRRCYRWSTIGIGILLCGSYLYTARSLSISAADVIMIVLLLAYFVISLLFYAWARKSLQALRLRKGWEDIPQQEAGTTPIDLTFTESKLAPSAWWFCTHMILIAATAVSLYLSYPAMQGFLPTMLDLAGNPVRYAPKSPQILCIPLLMQCFITLICAGIYSMVKNSRLRLDPADAEASLLRCRRFRRVWSCYALALGFVLDLIVQLVSQFLFLTPELRFLTPYLIGGALLVILGVTLWLGFITSPYAGRTKK